MDGQQKQMISLAHIKAQMFDVISGIQTLTNLLERTAMENDRLTKELEELKKSKEPSSPSA